MLGFKNYSFVNLSNIEESKKKQNYEEKLKKDSDSNHYFEESKNGHIHNNINNMSKISRAKSKDYFNNASFSNNDRYNKINNNNEIYLPQLSKAGLNVINSNSGHVNSHSSNHNNGGHKAINSNSSTNVHNVNSVKNNNNHAVKIMSVHKSSNSSTKNYNKNDSALKQLHGAVMGNINNRGENGNGGGSNNSNGGNNLNGSSKCNSYGNLNGNGNGINNSGNNSHNNRIIPIKIDKSEIAERRDRTEIIDRIDNGNRYLPIKKIGLRNSMKSIRSLVLNANQNNNTINNDYQPSNITTNNGTNPKSTNTMTINHGNSNSVDIFQENMYNDNKAIGNKNSTDISVNLNLSDIQGQQQLPVKSVRPKNRQNLSINQNNNSNQISLNLSFGNEVIVDDEAILLNLNMLEIWIDLENSIDNKAGVQNSIRKFLTTINEELLIKNTFKYEIFNSNNLNRIYQRCLKFQQIVVMFIKFCLIDFAWDGNMKSVVRKMINAITVPLVNIFDMFVIKKMTIESLKSDFYMKIQKIIVANKINKNTKLIDLYYQFGKQVDMVGVMIKQFSNQFFKFSLLKSIHTVGIDIIRSVNAFTVSGLALFIMENVLFGVIHLNSYANTEKKANKDQNSPTPVPIHVQAPFLPPDERDKEKLKGKNYTLVLDLDETLIHHFYTPSGGTFLIRPGAFNFLKTLSEIYEIAVFTAGTKDYADNILDVLDKDYRYIKHRLYRHHTVISGNSFVKDLSLLGRDMSKLIMIDNIADNFRLQPNNGLSIKTWNDDIKDSQLLDFKELLIDIYNLDVLDLRTIIKKIKEEVNKKASKNSFMLNPYSELNLQQLLNSEN